MIVHFNDTCNVMCTKKKKKKIATLEEFGKNFLMIKYPRHSKSLGVPTTKFFKMDPVNMVSKQ